MEDLTIQCVNWDKEENVESHRTEGLDGESLVVRRGQPFKVSLKLGGRAYDPAKHRLFFKILLGNLYVQIPVAFSKQVERPDWAAYFRADSLAFDPQNVSVYLCTPASAPVGIYQLELSILSPYYHRVYKVGSFTLLCNPWLKEDSVYMPLKSHREEYVQNDFGLLYMGTPSNNVARPWSFDQYEADILQICMKLLDVSPQHQKDWKADYLSRGDPVYIGRVVSAMINSQDDQGVLMGRWSGSYSDGVHPTKWTGSGDILKQWAASNFSPVKYGQCWVFAGVMCTVMRVLGIPCRVITNFNSAHDTNANLVIEEYYSVMGEKLPRSNDSIWNFHVWVEGWMRRKDLGMAFDGWQVLDPTPQERSSGIFCCGPASVKAVQDKELRMVYDVPFVYAEMNAEVHTFIVSDNKSFQVDVDTERVGALIYTKAIGTNQPQDITADYKAREAPVPYSMDVPANGPTIMSRSLAFVPEPAAFNRRPRQGLAVSLKFQNVPAAGDDISFVVVVANLENSAKRLRQHVNAQVKEYSNLPGGTIWEDHRVMQVGPLQTLEIAHQIPYETCKVLIGEDLVNLAVVIEDMGSQDRVLAFDEFNIGNPEILIEVPNAQKVVLEKEHQAQLTFKNPFRMAIGGVLTIVGGGLLENKINIRVHLNPGETMQKTITFRPKMAGIKMLHASLALSNTPIVVRGFQTIRVKPM
ncbi:transglutaminase 5, like [Alosa sapidissima]|uniref:transglutaminase 5, like n=1 Tax=Alosa sapidissima TaxID=34773 RepID=UPI001C0A26AB|nr:transglutaminase 5, like [Alosa sapidissima]